MEASGTNASNKEGEDDGRTIMVSGVPTDFRMEALQGYFENKKRSNGGPINGKPTRIHNSERVIIIYKSEKDAQNIVQKKHHFVSKFEFCVKWFTTLVWQKDAMIVSNVHKDTSQSKLIDFLERNAKLDIVYISPGDTSGTCLVYCQHEIDFEYVQKTCLKNCLMGNHLKVDRSEEIYSILVKTNSPKASLEVIELYFENKNKSSGGDISSVQELTPNSTYVVSFEEKSVVLDVCSRQHLLYGAELDVQPFWEPLEENTISRMEIHDFPLASKFLLIFLKQHKAIVNDQLKEWAKVIWEDCKYNKLKLKYAEGTFEKIDECLKDLLNSITVEIIDIPADIFTDIVESFKNKPDLKYIYFDYQNLAAHIIGFNKSNVTETKKILLNNLTIKQEEELSIHERHILSGLNFFAHTQREFKGLKIRTHGNKLIYEGCKSQVSKCQMKVSEIVKSIVKSKLCLPPNTGMIINTKPVKGYLIEKLKNNNCVGSWEIFITDSVLIYASGETNLSILEEIMKQTFVANKLDFIEKIKGTSNYRKWLQFLKHLKEEFQDLYFIGEDSLSFVAVDAVANDITSKIDNFRQSLINASSISISRGHFLFLKLFNDQDINEFGKKFKIEKMSLKENKLHLEGTEDQIKKVEIFIENLRKDITYQDEIFKMLGFQEFVNSKEGSNFLNEMQLKTESIILLNSDIESETDEILKFLYKKCAIELIEGDITTLNTDAIVNAANSKLEHIGGIAAAIVQKGGYEIQVESNNIISKRRTELQTGDVVSTKAGKLKCKTVIHAVGPRWSNGRNQELFSLSRVVTNCLSLLDKHSYTSIAIPAISTGIFGIPIEEGTKCIVESIKSYLDSNLGSNIKRICLIDIRKAVIRTFKLHLERMFKISQTEFTSSNTFLPDRQQKTSSMTPKTAVASERKVDISINLVVDLISDFSADVIVNSTNEQLNLDNGSLSKSILNAAGPQIQDECNKKYPNGINTSIIAVTKGYNLKCKNVFHVVLPSWNKNPSNLTLQNLTQIITKCLQTAEKMGARSIAFPILGAGDLKYSIETLPQTMYESVKIYSIVNTSRIKVVNFVVLPSDTEIIKNFDEYFIEIQKNKGLVSKGVTSSNPFLPGQQQKTPSMTPATSQQKTPSMTPATPQQKTPSMTPATPQQKTPSMTPATSVEFKGNADFELKLLKGSISDLSADVIVNSTTKDLQLHSGSLSKSILNAAGPQIQDECKQKYPNGINTYIIAVTKGYNLKCKNVFHVVLPSWNKNHPNLILQNLTQIITKCLQSADKMGARSIAFPILGAGNLQYPIDRLPQTMYEAVKQYSRTNTSQIKVVNFVIFPSETEIIQKFKEYRKKIQTNAASTSTDNQEIEEEEEDEEYEEYEEYNVTADHKDVGVVLKFFSKYKNLVKAIETVKEEYETKLTTEEIPLDIDLTELRKQKIKNISGKDKILINISNAIKIHGRHSHVKDAKITIQTLLMEFKKEDEETYIKGIVQWYYFDNSPGIWTKFNKEENAKFEKAYSQKKMIFTWRTIKYDIEKMCFKQNGKCFRMKRKPIQKADMLPDTWSRMGQDELFKSVELKDGKEYDDICTTFRQNLLSYRIIKVERIQNKTLYHGYQNLKRKFEVDNPNITNEVHNLWHGTSSNAVEGINNKGFNRSYCGKNATAFGEGVYFAKDIIYSARDTYSTPDSGRNKRIYKCSVLVGNVMQGQHGLKVLQDSYNSAADNIQRPSIYVIFHDSQAYPNYLITFST